MYLEGVRLLEAVARLIKSRPFSIEWGRKQGIRIYLDLHTLPESQNGW